MRYPYPNFCLCAFFWCPSVRFRTLGLGFTVESIKSSFENNASFPHADRNQDKASAKDIVSPVTAMIRLKVHGLHPCYAN